MAQSREKEKKHRKSGNRLGPDTWKRDGAPLYAALLIERGKQTRGIVPEPLRIDPVLLVNAATAVAAFNDGRGVTSDPTERAITVIPLFEDLDEEGLDQQMRELVQRALHYTRVHSFEDGEDTVTDPPTLDLVFRAVEQGMVRAYRAGMAEGERKGTTRALIRRKPEEKG